MDSTSFTAGAAAPAADPGTLFPVRADDRGAGAGSESRTPAQIASLKHRLTRIEGQVRGLGGLLDREIRCVDILTQSAAVISAMRGFEREILLQHARGPLAAALKTGDDAAMDEFSDCLRRSVR